MKISLLSLVTLLGAASTTSVAAFSVPTQSSTATVSIRSPIVNKSVLFAVPPTNNHDDESSTSMKNHYMVDEASASDSSSDAFMKNALTTASAIATVFMTSVPQSMAAGPDWGIFEGRTGSLLHPVMMFSLLAYSLYTALLGFQWRRQRTMGDEISALKKSLPNLNGASTVAAAMTAAKSSETVDQAYINKLQAAMPIEQQINELQKERKSLAEAGPRDKHFSQGALLAFLGTAFAIEGPLNTYARAGKLFPGPHLYAGAGLVVLWALAASCVPAMQKGNDTARAVHIGANFAGIGLFAWQVVSGIPILLKVIENTKWP